MQVKQNKNNIKTAYTVVYTCVLLPYGIGIGIVIKKGNYHYVGLCGYASTRIYRTVWIVGRFTHFDHTPVFI